MSKISQTTLGDLIEFQRGYDLPKSEFKEGNVPVISSNGILGYHNEAKVKAPGITIGRSGTVGLPHYIKVDYFPHNTALFIKDFKGNFPKYIYYLIKTLRLNEFKSGSGVPTMNRNHLHPLKVNAYLDPKIQEKTTSVLSCLDSKIELNNRINAELEAMAKTLYDYWFVQFDFPFDFAQGKPNAKGKPYKTSGGKMVWSEELRREIPEGWEVRKLEDVENNIITGKTPSTENQSYFNGDIPFICIGDVRGNMHIVDTEIKLTEEGANTQKNKFIPKGSICVTCIATPGLVGFATKDSQTNQQLNSIICEKFENQYYLYFYLTDYFKYARAKTGNTFANMNKGDFSSILVVKPSKEVLINFSEKVKPLVEIILNNSLQNQQLASLRDWLLPMLMNGQVKVSEL
ncbi:MAG: restriction endonuclease subunit S [Bacteroidetes bacterium]|nr:restriction endonuclease subunit S [Bacteroidota bacterium]